MRSSCAVRSLLKCMTCVNVDIAVLMCRPPGFVSFFWFRWLTPPASMCRPPGYVSLVFWFRWLTPPASMCRLPGYVSLVFWFRWLTPNGKYVSPSGLNLKPLPTT